MTLYSLYSKPENGPEAIVAIGERFSVSALLFTPFWAVARGAWTIFLTWIGIVALLWLSSDAIGGAAALLLYVLFALWSGFAAPQAVGNALMRRGWIAHGELAAPNAAMAETLWLKIHYGARP